jgi:hypothetical protein
MELFGLKDELKREIEIVNPKPVFYDLEALKKLQSVNELKCDHPIREFVLKRKIPEKYYGRLYSCPSFKKWVNHVKPKAFEDDTDGESRLVIPFFTAEKRLIAIQGRRIFDATSPKYITVSMDAEHHPVFGLDTIDVQKDVYVFEGPIDAMFIDNSIAVAGSNLTVASKYVPKEKMILVFDNEPRNEQNWRRMIRAVSQGYRVVVWKDTWPYKDVNEAVMNGVDSKLTIQRVINRCVSSGPEAALALTFWKRF